MDRSLQVTNIKTESSSIDRLDIPIEMQLNSVKQESVCLDQLEMYIKTEPKEDENEFPVIAGTSYEVYTNHDMKIETEEPLIKIKCEDLDSEEMQDPLNVSNEIKVEERFPIDLDQGEPRIKTEPSEREKYENLLKTNKNDSHGSRSNNSQHPLLIRNDSDQNKNSKYICDVCNMTFRWKCDFDRHVRIHTGEKPFKCDVCRKSFCLKGALDRHMLIHSGEKPHSCNLCKKVFNQKGNLNAHMLIHSGKKQFSCNECNKSFSQKVSLVWHQRTHTGDKPYTCDLCKKGFTVKTNLITHRRLHTGEKPYCCDICNKCFAQKSNLIKHKKIHNN